MKNLLLAIFFILFLSGNVFSQKTNQADWSSMKTLSVPYNERISEFEKGNLIPNASFEKGELGNSDSDSGLDTLLHSFRLDNWQKIGNNVEWVSTEHESYNEEDISTGKHAIKIHREFKDIKELNNSSDGIISDFIEVIPGNYYFSFDIRLERIFPAVQRYSSKISRDIDIRITYFDENKKEMSPGIYYEYYGREVDNGFKGYAFSNFYYIDTFDWGKVRGRTYNYPFSEGDMPDGCKYVKISLGLLGRGTMYVDNIDFHYSRWNFTSLERIKPYFEKDLKKTNLIIPTPKKVSEITEINLKTNKAIIVIPNEPENTDLSAAGLLKKHFGKKTQIVKASEFKEEESRTVFVIGKNDLFRENTSEIVLTEIANEEEGYVIKKIGNKVFLVGNTIKGTYLAATTLVQLYDKKTKIYHHADITDFPDFKGRSYIFNGYVSKWTLEQDTSLTAEQRQNKYDASTQNMAKEFELIDYYAFFKLNKVYTNYGSLSKKWWAPGEAFNKLYKGAGKICDEIGTINTAIMINPYFHFEYEQEEGLIEDSLRNLFSHSNPDDIKKITDLIDMVVKNGAETVMIAADDFMPHAETTRGQYALFTDKDKSTYANIAAAQSAMMNTISKKYGKDIRLEFCPAPYLNEFVDYGMGSAEAFFRDFTATAPKDMAIVWTGNTVRSLSYDMADIKRYADLIGRKPMLWDNTPYARESASSYGGYPALYPGKTVMCSLFEPYDVIVPKDFYKYMDKDIYSNGGGFSERYMIKYPTFSDFAWNNNAYDPDLSLYKVLLWLYGKDNAMTLLQFNDSYFKLVSIWAEIKNSKAIPKEEKEYIVSEKQIAEANLHIKDLKSYHTKLSKSIKNERLLKELEREKESLLKRYEAILKSKNTGERTKGYRQN